MSRAPSGSSVTSISVSPTSFVSFITPKLLKLVGRGPSTTPLRIGLGSAPPLTNGRQAVRPLAHRRGELADVHLVWLCATDRVCWARGYRRRVHFWQLHNTGANDNPTSSQILNHVAKVLQSFQVRRCRPSGWGCGSLALFRNPCCELCEERHPG